MGHSERADERSVEEDGVRKSPAEKWTDLMKEVVRRGHVYDVKGYLGALAEIVGCRLSENDSPEATDGDIRDKMLDNDDALTELHRAIRASEPSDRVAHLAREIILAVENSVMRYRIEILEQQKDW